MTDALIHDVVAAIRDADAKTPPQPYGRSQIADNHHLTPAKARALLAFIKDNDLLRESA